MSQIEGLSLDDTTSSFLMIINQNLDSLFSEEKQQIQAIAMRLSIKEQIGTSEVVTKNEKMVKDILSISRVGKYIEFFTQAIEKREILSDYSIGAFGLLPQGGHGNLFASKSLTDARMSSLDGVIDSELRDVEMNGYISTRLNVNKIGSKNGISYYILDRACRAKQDNRSGNHFVLVLSVPTTDINSFQEIFSNIADINLLWSSLNNKLREKVSIPQDITALPVNTINIVPLNPNNAQRFMGSI